ncbi:MAG TPA: hypothetical protein PK836_09515 [Syntrophales bacterium]|nr:hypothetical protein [Syntrophales bacterium]HOM07954.1 hypothetical protein [Syntrophales bacterium]HOO00648.1 hypothetical protein [Syntrophales bacterium]HPC01902.1 hypothetical protein [Syntrophales bacterium]HRS87798.1 hypothetical protein [Syntrophales bacterium]
MKKTLSTIIVAGAIVLLTATFGFAELAATGAEEFPYFQLGLLIVGGLIILSMKHRFHRMYTSEAVGAFALYTLYVSLFTNPVMDMVRHLVG